MVKMTPAARDQATELDARNIKWVPCGTCNWPTPLITVQRCDDCFEVESRIDAYLKCGRGRALVRRRLAIAVAVREK